MQILITSFFIFFSLIFFSLEYNPRYILRNWMAQIAIEKAQKDDFTEVCEWLIFRTHFGQLKRENL